MSTFCTRSVSLCRFLCMMTLVNGSIVQSRILEAHSLSLAPRVGKEMKTDLNSQIPLYSNLHLQKVPIAVRQLRGRLPSSPSNINHSEAAPPPKSGTHCGIR
ncbi:hypothetical protein MPTK1_7g04740 [Marchantia polymorpha subsp. ruderalis]|uniref:Secreted protein n=2 Tax=Marchantia polymorpha TaxID=3197 RepID=A0AAF6BW67_MARPO|nr:hypothetical protein MARPO_0062s0052 [Marchantia polymorpha]BBN16251.1 hypothetical protein Mp_7g04740 [Marchantia polymorpha subsp. ruderalis]|eukprot:PTQ36630.1 hypothetical protein MARPO_0062s0052 [Marchantia polymorpha]